MSTASVTQIPSREHQVLQAAAALVDAFASNDTARYFACFSEDATFLFHTLAQPLTSRHAYEQVWQQWQAEGFAVLGCQSSNGQVSLQGEVAIFMHDVATHIRLGGEEHQLQERETIVFRHHGERWLACHEHLSVLSDA
ncbi:YybH family protein [Pseudomonas huaxiensis]|uniref:YybH family protein n=1 Tax=Pseudomonas huaxiensis TaxID=2213017 RepID=UPI001CDCA44D|nr:nuclear transport factor 2 family protein [Pseudomonas huaxiensis]